MNGCPQDIILGEVLCNGCTNKGTIHGFVEVICMQYAIELYYDKETEQKLFNLAKRVADEKLSTKFLEWKTRPHLTLACFNDVEEEICIKQLKEFAQNHKRMPAYIGSVGMFNDTKTIFVSPVMNSNMYQFQRELHEYLKILIKKAGSGIVQIVGFHIVP